MAEVSDDDVRRKLREVLKDTDLNTTTEKKLRKQLEEHFGCDLKPRKQIFKEEIESFLAQCDVFQQEEDDELEAEAAVDDAPKAKAKRKGRTTPQTFSEELCTFLNVSEAAEMSRADVVKRIWDYIKEHELQDPSNGRKILADEKLETLFTFPLNMFSMNKQISRHCKASSNLVGQEEKPAKKAKKAATKASKAENGDTEATEKKKPSGFTLPQKLSPELAAVVGSETASRGDCTKKLWAYIKEHGLQSEENKSIILVKNDPKLHALLGVDECKGFSMSTHLKGHFLGRADV